MSEALKPPQIDWKWEPEFYLHVKDGVVLSYKNAGCFDLHDNRRATPTLPDALTFAFQIKMSNFNKHDFEQWVRDAKLHYESRLDEDNAFERLTSWELTCYLGEYLTREAKA